MNNKETNMSIELKIKFKHLALEPAIIRKEEYNLLRQIAWYKQHYQIKDISGFKEALKILYKYQSLQHHRTVVVRNEARATHLARAFIAGKSYSSVEKTRKDERLFQTQIIPKIFSMVAKYGNERVHQKYDRNTKTYGYTKEDTERLTKAIEEWSKLE